MRELTVAKAKQTKAPKKADEVPAEVAKTVEEAAAKPAAETITKAEAVRKALAAGKDNPTKGVAYVKAEYGLEMSTAMFSTYKGAEKKKAEGGKPARAAKEPTPSSKPIKVDTVELVRQVKELVETYGADAVRDMTKVFES